MLQRVQFAHSLLWRGDALYRRPWWFVPQILAVLSVVWLLTATGADFFNSPGDNAAGWGVPSSPPQSETPQDGAALVSRAETDPSAFASLISRADNGDPLMEFYAGTLYDPDLKISKIVAPNAFTAMRYYLASAEKGTAGAAYNYGYGLAFGLGVPRDTPTGVQWLTKAANANYTRAATVLGIIYKSGAGIPQDRPLSLQWFQKAADSGDHYSQAEIGAAYWDGIPPYGKNPATAVSWYLKATGDPLNTYAARQLGIAYLDGNGVAHNSEQARYWFHQAAAHGDKVAAQLEGTVRW